jgi:hypothetical protein
VRLSDLRWVSQQSKRRQHRIRKKEDRSRARSTQIAVKLGVVRLTQGCVSQKRIAAALRNGHDLVQGAAREHHRSAHRSTIGPAPELREYEIAACVVLIPRSHAQPGRSPSHPGHRTLLPVQGAVGGHFQYRMHDNKIAAAFELMIDQVRSFLSTSTRNPESSPPTSLKTRTKVTYRVKTRTRGTISTEADSGTPAESSTSGGPFISSQTALMRAPDSSQGMFATARSRESSTNRRVCRNQKRGGARDSSQLDVLTRRRTTGRTLSDPFTGNADD